MRTAGGRVFIELPRGHGKNTGSALLLVLLALCLLSFFGANAISLATLDSRISGNYRKQAQAFGVAEAGLDACIARIRSTLTWRGDDPPEAPAEFSGTLSSTSFEGTYTVSISDGADDGQGAYDPTLPGRYVRLVSVGSVGNSFQRVSCLLQLLPDSGSLADSPYTSVVSLGDAHLNGTHHVNGYDDQGNEVSETVPNDMVCTYCPDYPSRINEEALKGMADRRMGYLDDVIEGQEGFFKDPPENKEPWIIHVTGDMSLSGKKTVYGILFVEGRVKLSGEARVVGVIYAPNVPVVSPLEINGGGVPGDQPVMGQVIAGPGGVEPAGEHADVQLVKEYVDAFNDFGGPVVRVVRVPGSWRQY